jgi:hypothetical protein
MSDFFLNPPLPSNYAGGDSSLNLSNMPAMTTGNWPSLPSLSSLPGSGSDSTASGSSIGNLVSGIVNPSSNQSTPTSSAATSDSIVTRAAFLLLAIFVIFGAIWTYKK